MVTASPVVDDDAGLMWHLTIADRVRDVVFLDD
jgi:hypothetical protein